MKKSELRHEIISGLCIFASLLTFASIILLYPTDFSRKKSSIKSRFQSLSRYDISKSLDVDVNQPTNNIVTNTQPENPFFRFPRDFN